MPEITRTKRGLDLGTAADLADLFHQLSHDKKTRKIVAKAVKEIAPDSPYANAFADVDTEERFEALKAEQEAKETERQRREVVARMENQRARLLTGEGGRKYDEAQIKEIETLMQSRGITDYEDGAILFSAKNPPDSPQPGKDIPQHGATWEFPEWAKFGKDPVSASRDTAHQVITEFMRKRA